MADSNTNPGSICRQAVAVIDVEGFTFPRGGSNRRPLTTLVPFAVAVAKVHVLTGTPISSRTWLVRPDGLGECSDQDRLTIKCAIRRCGNGHLLGRAQRQGLPARDVLDEVLEYVGDLRLYARGVAMEQRFLSGTGLCGETAVQREAVAGRVVVDLASCGCPPFPAGLRHEPEEEVLFFAEHAAREERRLMGFD